MARKFKAVFLDGPLEGEERMHESSWSNGEPDSVIEFVCPQSLGDFDLNAPPEPVAMMPKVGRYRLVRGYCQPMLGPAVGYYSLEGDPCG